MEESHDFEDALKKADSRSTMKPPKFKRRFAVNTSRAVQREARRAGWANLDSKGRQSKRMNEIGYRRFDSRIVRSPLARFQYYSPTRISPSLKLEGFRNIGNSCYMNAVIRSLVSIPSFIDQLTSCEATLTSGHEPRPSFYLSLLEVVKQLNQSQRSVISLARLKEAIAKNEKRFASYTQEDAHEFLIACLCQLEDEVLAFKKGQEPKNEEGEEIPTIEQPEQKEESKMEDSQESDLFNEDKSLLQRSDKPKENGTTEQQDKDKELDVLTGAKSDLDAFRLGWLNELKSTPVIPSIPPTVQTKPPPVPLSPEALEALKCPITLCFDCTVEAVIVCKQCKHRTTLEELYRDFSLDIPQGEPLLNPPSLAELFLNYFEPEEVLYSCESCGHEEAIQKRNLKKLPQVLVLHLKRFTFAPSEPDKIVEHTITKLWDPVRINKNMYIEPSHIEGLCSGDALEALIKELDEKWEKEKAIAEARKAIEEAKANAAKAQQSATETQNTEKSQASVEIVNKDEHTEKISKAEEKKEEGTGEGKTTKRKKAEREAMVVSDEESAKAIETGSPIDTTHKKKMKQETDQQPPVVMQIDHDTEFPRQIDIFETKEREQKETGLATHWWTTPSKEEEEEKEFKHSRKAPSLWNHKKGMKGGKKKKGTRAALPPPPDLLSQMQSNPFHLPGILSNPFPSLSPSTTTTTTTTPGGNSSLFPFSSSLTSLTSTSSASSAPSSLFSSLGSFSFGFEDDQLQRVLQESKEAYELEEALKASQMEFQPQGDATSNTTTSTTTTLPTPTEKIAVPPATLPSVATTAMVVEETRENEKEEAPEVTLATYRLCSILSHKGFSTVEGHYITDVYNRVESKWTCHNDAITKQIKEKKALGPTRQRNGYLFFFALDG